MSGFLVCVLLARGFVQQYLSANRERMHRCELWTGLLLSIVAAVLLVDILYWIWRHNLMEPFAIMSFGFVVGGFLGNLWPR